MADNTSSDEDILQKNKDKNADGSDQEDSGDDQESSLSEEEDEDARLARLEKEQEEEIRKHQIAMAKRMAKKEEIKQRKAKGEVISPEEEAQNPFRSSRGFLSKTESSMSLISARNGDHWLCPFPRCGRKFTSEDQLKNHIERRHKLPEEEKQKSSSVLKKQPATAQADHQKQSTIQNKVIFDTQKKQSNKGAQILEVNPKADHQSELTFSEVDTPVPEKSKRPQDRQSKDAKDQQKSREMQLHSFEAKPKARPITSWGATGKKGAVGSHEPVSKEQKEILNDIMKGNAKAIAQRPQTAATSSLRDEQRIIAKLKYLEKIEQRIDQDLEEFVSRRGDAKKKQRKGVQVTKQMLLEASQHDQLDHIDMVILRDKNISVFEPPVAGSPGAWKYDDLMNLECLYASHNLIKDIFGIGQLTTIRELNLSFNLIVDISPIDQLDLLEKLFLNRNKIQIIDPIKKLTSLQSVGFFHNDIFSAESSLEVLVHLGTKYRLREISIDGNPISSTTRFRNQLILNIPKLEVLDEDKIQPLDREVAKQYYEMHNIPLPQMKSAIQARENELIGEHLADTTGQTAAASKDPNKKVKFSVAIDNDHEGDWRDQEIKKLEERYAEALRENAQLQHKLDDKYYTATYKENEIMQQEIKNMYILQEENKDLREDLNRLRKLTYDDKIKEMAEENQMLRKRNGMLLIQNDELQTKLEELRDQMTNATSNTGAMSPQKSQANRQFNQPIGAGLVRPQTAAGAFGRRKQDLKMLDDDDLYLNAQDQLDKELNQLIERNQNTLSSLHADMREVSKIVGEPTIQVRKIKNQPTKVPTINKQESVPKRRNSKLVDQILEK